MLEKSSSSQHGNSAKHGRVGVQEEEEAFASQQQWLLVSPHPTLSQAVCLVHLLVHRTGLHGAPSLPFHFILGSATSRLVERASVVCWLKRLLVVYAGAFLKADSVFAYCTIL